MKKIVVAFIAGILMVGSAHAQDDVSIMDLKETVYLLLKDVQGMKSVEEKVLSEAKATSSSNNDTIQALDIKVSGLEQSVNQLREKEILKDYKVSSKLKSYINN